MTFGSMGIILFCLFHTLVWWQQAFLVNVIMVSQDSKGLSCRPNCNAICFFIPLFFKLLKILVSTPKGNISDNIQAGG